MVGQAKGRDMASFRLSAQSGLLTQGEKGSGVSLALSQSEKGEELGLEGTRSDEILTPPTVLHSRIPRRSYVAVAILFFVNLLNYMDRLTIAGVLRDLQNDYKITNAQGGLLQTVFICSYMVCAPVFGFLGDRYSRKWVMGFGIFIWSAAVLLSTFVPNDKFWLFLLCRGLVGIGEASYSTVSPTLIADMFTKDLRSRMLMIFYFAIPVGSGLGFVVGSNVAFLMGSWRWGLRVTPIFGALCLFLISVVLKEPKRGEAETSSAKADSSWFSDIKNLAQNRSYVWSTLAFTAVAFVAGCLSWWTPNFVIYGVKESGEIPQDNQINLVFGIITCLSGFLGVTIGSMWAQVWRKRNGRADPLVCGIGLFVALPFLIASLHLVNHNIHVTWALMFLGITGLSLNWAVVSDILLYIVIPSRRATASAMQILLSHLFGDAVSPYIVGMVSDALKGEDESAAAQFYSLRYALYIPSGALIFGGVFFMIAAYYVADDRRKAELITSGLASDGKGRPLLSMTETSASMRNEESAISIAKEVPETDRTVISETPSSPLIENRQSVVL